MEIQRDSQILDVNQAIRWKEPGIQQNYVKEPSSKPTLPIVIILRYVWNKSLRCEKPLRSAYGREDVIDFSLC